MIDIAPKALRFARLAALEVPFLARNPQVLVIKNEERNFTSSLESGEKASRSYIRISEETAAFCLKAMSSLLEKSSVQSNVKQENGIKSSQWDDNDIEYLSNVMVSLDQQLSLRRFQLR